MTTVPAAMSTRNQGRYYGNGRDWETPPELFASLDQEFNFTLDPCCTPETAKCSLYFTEAEDGLAQDWGTHRVFMNPPYGKEIYAWTRKAKEAASKGALVVGLLPASTDLSWWHEDVLEAGAEIRYLRGRVKFRNGEAWANAFSASVVIVWRPEVTKQAEAAIISIDDDRSHLAGDTPERVAGPTVAIPQDPSIERFRMFLRLMNRLETRWVRTGDPELRAIADELYEWERRG